MNTDRIAGRINEFVGRLMQTCGLVTGNRRLEASGLIRNILGNSQAVHGSARPGVLKRRLTPF